MATLVVTDMSVQDIKSATVNGLTASDTYTHCPGDLLYIRNTTAGALTLLFDGDGGTTIAPHGAGVISTAGGYSTGSLPANSFRLIDTDTIAEFLRGTVTITGGAGMQIIVLRR